MFGKPKTKTLKGGELCGVGREGTGASNADTEQIAAG